MNALRLSLRVLRADRRTRLAAALTAVGVAVATALVVFLSTLPNATQARSERSAWQAGQEQAGMVTLASQDFVHGRQIVRLDVAGGPGSVPGSPRLPGPDQVLLSPELAEQTRRLPPDQLADRFPGRVVGVLDERSLRYPEQLVAVVGHLPGALDTTAAEEAGARLAGDRATQDFLLDLLAWVGIVLLAVPSLVLVASAARLTAARRERRLAALRLAGATPAQVVATVVAETAIAAAAGTAAGLLLGWPSRYLAVLVPWGGGTWMVSDFTPALTTVVAVAVVIPSLVVLAAVFGLRRVVRAPLGAAMEHSRPRVRAWRLLALVAVGAFFAYGVFQLSETGSIVMLIAGLAAIVVSASIVGPWVTATVGALFVKLWRRPLTLLAGRGLRNDPKAAYRSASGVVLAVFVGSMALTLLPGFESKSGGGGSFKDHVLYVDVPAARLDQVKQRVAEQLSASATPATVAEAERVRIEGPGEVAYSGLIMDCAQAAEMTRMAVGACAGPPGVRADPSLGLPVAGLRVQPQSGDEPASIPLPDGVVVRPLGGQDPDVAESVLVDRSLIPGPTGSGQIRLAVAPPSEGDREKVRTAITLAAPGIPVDSRELVLSGQQTMLSDLRRVTTIGLTIAAVLAGCSAAIAAAASVVDRRRTFGALIAAGTPVRMLVRALRIEAALPALVATSGAGVGGVLVGTGMLSLFGVDGVFLHPWIFAPVVLGVLVALLAASACGPVLRRVSAEPFAAE